MGFVEVNCSMLRLFCGKNVYKCIDIGLAWLETIGVSSHNPVYKFVDQNQS